MGRSMRAAKASSTATETAVAKFLAKHVDDRIERRRLSGAKDRGDISGLRVHGQRVVIEVKDTAVNLVKPYLDEAETERINDEAMAAFVVQKRQGIGHAKPGELLVQMRLRDLVALLTGTRPGEE